MKKYFSLLIITVLAIFMGVGFADAATSSLSILDPDCQTTTEGTKTITHCTISGKANKTETINFTDHFEVRYNKRRTGFSDFEFVSEVSGKQSNLSKKDGTNDEINSLGGTFDFTYTNFAVEEGKTYVLFELNIFGDASLVGENEYVTIGGRQVKACGGSISRVLDGSSSGGSSGGAVEPKDTGFSIPVAIIGVGTVGGLVIYSSTSKKTKMHRI